MKFGIPLTHKVFGGRIDFALVGCPPCGESFGGGEEDKSPFNVRIRNSGSHEWSGTTMASGFYGKVHEIFYYPRLTACGCAVVLAAVLIVFGVLIRHEEQYWGLRSEAVIGKTAEEIITEFGRPHWNSRECEDDEDFVLSYRTRTGSAYGVHIKGGVVVRVSATSM